MPDVIQDYVENRTEALANVFLTRDPRIVVTKLDLADFDLLAFIRPRADEPTKVLAACNVILWGTPLPLPDEEAATRHGNQLWKRKRGKADICTPVVALLFSMDDDQAFYAWAAVPSVDHSAASEKVHYGLPRLVTPEKLEFKRINRKSLEVIIMDVKEWYEALADIIYQKE